MCGRLEDTVSQGNFSPENKKIVNMINQNLLILMFTVILILMTRFG